MKVKTSRDPLQEIVDAPHHLSSQHRNRSDNLPETAACGLHRKQLTGCSRDKPRQRSLQILRTPGATGLCESAEAADALAIQDNDDFIWVWMRSSA